MLDSGAEGPGFKSQSRRCRVTVLGKLLTFASVHQAAKLVAALLRVAGVTAGLAETNGSLPPNRLVYDSRHLLDQLRNPMLGNRVWATFTFNNPKCRPCKLPRGANAQPLLDPTANVMQH